MLEKIGRYEIKKELGRGGMATVYLAYDPRFRREVAIKVLPPQFTHDPRFLARFEQEAQMIAALEDPAIVPVHDFGEQDNAPYIVMRYMPGGSLRDQLGGKPLPLSQITTILQRLGPALDEAHRRGIIHRDIKPDNVLFDAKGRPYLADFGIARMAEATRTMTVVGTPSYMSPEQVQGKQKLDWRSDLYALGVMLFEMLTGRQPYEAETPSGQMFMHVMEPIPDARMLNPDLPPQAQEVVEKAIAKDPRERYQSAGEMVQGVASLRLAGGESIAGPVEAGIVSGAALPEIEERGGPITGGEAESAEDGADRKGEKKAEAQQTVREPLPAAEPALLADSPSEDRAPSMEQPPPPRVGGAAAGGLPGWIWWVGAGAVLVVLAFGIRAAFFGGDNSGTAQPQGVPVVEDEPTPTPTLEDEKESAPLEPTDTPTTEPTPTNTPTPAPDQDQPPPNPQLGSVSERLQDGMTIVYVPAGSFLMGSADGWTDEQPLHEVTLEGFWIDRTEVTNEQFAAFLNEMDNQEEGGVTWLDIEGSNQIVEQSRSFSARSSYVDLPVIEVSWYGAAAYCDWVGGQLPSEAQWEYAARGPDSLTYPWGEGDPTCDLAQFSDCAGQTVPVGSYEAGGSWVGALDMAGNAWEWINDWYGEEYYTISLGSNPPGPTSGVYKVLRGGSWLLPAPSLRSAVRSGNVPDNRNISIGFRCSLPGE